MPIETMMIAIAAFFGTMGASFLTFGIRYDWEIYLSGKEKEITDLQISINDILPQVSEIIAPIMTRRTTGRGRTVPEEAHEEMLVAASARARERVMKYYWSPGSPLRLSVQQETTISSLRWWEPFFSYSSVFLGVIFIAATLTIIVLLVTNTVLSCESGMLVMFLLADLFVTAILMVAISCIKCRRLKKKLSEGLKSCRIELEKLRQEDGR